MAVFACTRCGWVRRTPAVLVEAVCPVCAGPARSLTPTGSLEPGRAAVAAASARALHAPGAVPLSGTKVPDAPPAA